jgi:outer membrane protein assembly factor BamB
MAQEHDGQGTRPDHQSAAAPVGGARPRRRPWRVIRSVIWTVVVFGSLAGILLLRVHGDALEYAEANMATLLLAVVVVGALIHRVCFWGDTHWAVRWLPIAGVVAAIAACCLMLRVDRVSGHLVPKLVWRWAPKADQLLDAAQAVTSEEVDLRTTTRGDFPQFLGPHRDLVVKGMWLRRDWAAHGPRQVWRQPIGAAWSGFSAVNGYATTMEQRGEDELVTCYEVTTGRLRWVHGVRARYDTVTGGVGPRCTPTIDDGRVYALGATGVLRCLDGRQGTLVWSDDLLRRFGATPEEDVRAVAWGRSASPLVVDNLVIVPLGGPKGGPYQSLAAYDKKTGELVWTGGATQISYASPSLVELCGVRQVLIVNESTVSAHRLEDGQVLWSWEWPGGSTSNATVSQAVAVAANRVLLSKAYGVGAALIELTRLPDGQWQVSQVWKRPQFLRTKFTNVAQRDGCAFGLSDGMLECIQLDDAGTRRWKFRRGDYGPGQILMVEDVILVQAECGDVVMVEANAQDLVELGRFPALSDQTWNNLCLYDHFLLVRNSVEAACYDLPLREAGSEDLQRGDP